MDTNNTDLSAAEILAAVVLDEPKPESSETISGNGSDSKPSCSETITITGLGSK